MSEWAPKRFWTDAEVAQADPGFTVTLDGRSVQTPAKRLLVLPTRAFAEAVAAEWQDQTDRIDPQTMPFTRSANSALDKVAPQKDEVVTLLAAYGDSDLLCYRADRPADLVTRQQAGWDPMLDWAETAFGARLEPHVGVMHKPQSPEALARLRAPLETMSPFALAGFHDLVSLSGSLVLALAAALKARPVETLWDLSRIDERWQEEQWGEDDEASAVARRKRGEFLHAERVFHLSAA